MENEEYTKFKLEYATKLNELRYKFVTSTEMLFHNSDFKEAAYYVSLMNKATELIDGFFILMKDKNLTCLTILLRVQLDNCMRTLAGSIVEDKETYFANFQNPEIRISKMKDINGRKLTDSNLRKYLNAYDESFNKIYMLASEYVHYSGSSLMSILEYKNNNEMHIYVGGKYNELTIKAIYEISKAFLYFLDLQYLMIQEIYRQKSSDYLKESILKEYS